MGGIAEWTFEGGPEPFDYSRDRRLPHPLPARHICQYMKRGPLTGQFEWHRGFCSSQVCILLHAWDFFILSATFILPIRPPLPVPRSLTPKQTWRNIPDLSAPPPDQTELFDVPCRSKPVRRTDTHYTRQSINIYYMRRNSP